MIRNILGLAMTIIPKQEALLFRWTGRESNDLGLDVDTFDPPVPLKGSIQPVDRTRYAYLGLDASKKYISVYSTTLAGTVTKIKNPDQIEYQGSRWEVMADTDWHAPADYSGLLAVQINEGANDPDGE
ncbi:hypothetical protein LJC36_00235 [Desulfovibrio sp. OttesenSCG-928-C14]|nr:hypothetical protein [Desulfovibrio sp. OttesenSCG-928-C14]